MQTSVSLEPSFSYSILYLVIFFTIILIFVLWFLEKSKKEKKVINQIENNNIKNIKSIKLKYLKKLIVLENKIDKNEITIRDLIKASLRLRPDRIVVGEVRGDETLDMVQAMTTGHDGSLSTGHGNSPQDMMSRLETMILMGMDMSLSAVRKQLVSAIDIIIHLGRLRDRTRRVMKIVEIAGLQNGEVQYNTLFEFKETGEKDGKVLGGLVSTQKELMHKEKMLAAGIS